jgi:phage baseplate assembly protein V
MDEMLYRLSMLEQKLNNVVRDGTVEEVQSSPPRCRVRSGKLLTDWLPWYSFRAGATSVWSSPSIGEQCTVLSPSGNLAAGKVLRGIPCESYPLPTGATGDTVIQFPDGHTLTHSAEAHEFRLSCGLKVDGGIHATEEIHSDVQVSAQDIGLTTHHHANPSAGNPIP